MILRLAQATGTFRQKMALAETVLAEGSLERSDVQALVENACTEMIGCLQEHVGSAPFARGVTEYIKEKLVVWLSDGRSTIKIPPQRFIYSMGLIDYLEDRRAKRIAFTLTASLTRC